MNDDVWDRGRGLCSETGTHRVESMQHVPTDQVQFEAHGHSLQQSGILTFNKVPIILP